MSDHLGSGCPVNHRTVTKKLRLPEPALTEETLEVLLIELAEHRLEYDLRLAIEDRISKRRHRQHRPLESG